MMCNIVVVNAGILHLSVSLLTVLALSVCCISLNLMIILIL